MRSILVFLISAVLLAGCSGTQVLNNLTPESGYKTATNVIYSPGQDLRMDIYTPNGLQNAPVVLFFYGGRWSSGSKDEYKFVGEALASRGFVAAIADYRLYPKVRFPAFVEDGARAVKWLNGNVQQYGGNPQKIFVMGHSAGAHIAALLSVREIYLEKVGGSRSMLRGMIGLAGPYDFLPITDPTLRDIFGPPENFEYSQPVLFAEGDNPPMLLMHGEDDDTVWVKNTRNLAAAVSKAGGPVETVIYPKMGHGRMVASLSRPLRGQTDVIQHVADFVTRWSDQRYVDSNAPTGGIETVPLQP
ncbi:MAG: alpha/beta hydrolase [Panacagrimonas sp.]